MFNLGQKNTFKFFILAVALMLIVSFLAHDIIPHHHKVEIFGTGMQALFHGGERKLLYLMLLAIAIASILNKKVSIVEINRISSFYFSHWRIEISRIFNPISQALRTGILNPKLCD